MNDIDGMPKVIDAISQEALKLENLLCRPENFVERLERSPWFVPRPGRIEHLLATVWSIREQKSIVFVPERYSSASWAPTDVLDRLHCEFGSAGLYAFYTSGSSGFPKLVAHSHSNLLESASLMVRSIPSLAVGTYWHIFPHSYMAGVLNSVILPWVVGQEIVLSEPFGPKTPFLFPEFVRNYNLKNLWLSPSMIRALSLRTKKKDWRSVSTVVNATGPISEAIHSDFVGRFEVNLHNSYGSTEQLFVSVTRDGQAFSGVGQPLEGVSIEILPGGSGEGSRFQITSPTTALAMFEQPNRRIELKMGLEHSTPILSADIGFIKDGNLWLTGRADDLVVIGGENVSLNQYEMVVKDISGVIEAVATARDSYHFSSIEVVVELSPHADTDRVRTEANQRFLQVFGPRRSPGNVVFGCVPRLTNGKPDRQTLRGKSEQ